MNYRSRFAQGSIFEIVLPQAVLYASTIVCEERTEKIAVAPVCGTLFEIQGWRIVVVEDDPMVAKSIELSLNT